MFQLLRQLLTRTAKPKAIPPSRRPTIRQEKYANMLGIKFASETTREELSHLIGAEEAANPKLRQNRERVLQEKIVDENAISEKSQTAEDYWNDLREKDAFVLAIYRKGKADVIVDVLHVWGAYHNERDQLRIEFAAPKYHKRDDFLMWEREFELAPEKLLYHELLEGNFVNLPHSKYVKTVDKGLKIAKKMKL